jgi:hypothetical protein
MPAKPSWHADIPKIRRKLAALDAPFLDRPVVERLFSVRRRQANNLMRILGGYKLGAAMVVDRQELILRLDQMAARRGVAGEQTKRKSSVLEALEALQRDARPRRVAPPLPRAAKASLPSGLSVTAPGELTLQFSSPEELLGSILSLVQSASKDFASFVACLDYPSLGVAYVQPQNATPQPEAGQKSVPHPQED